MTLAFALLAVAGAIIFIFSFDNKEPTIVFGGLLMLFFGVAAGISYNYDQNIFYERSKNQTDLPEEHQLISHNKLKPDTLLGYYRNDTLVIEFKH